MQHKLFDKYNRQYTILHHSIVIFMKSFTTKKSPICIYSHTDIIIRLAQTLLVSSNTIHLLIIHLSTKSYSIKRRRKGGVNVVDPVSYQYHTSSTHCILICPISGVTTTTIDYLHLLYSSYDPSH